MARARAKRRKGSFKISLLTVAGATPLAITTYNGFKAGGIPKALSEMTYALTGYNPATKGFDFSFTVNGLWPIIGAGVMKRILSKLGVNRLFNKIPFISM